MGITQPPNSSRLFNGIARQNYTPKTALADIIDNCISAKATDISVSFRDLPNGNTRVYIADNGIGMSLDHLARAMQIGSEAGLANGPLSVFGYGMKAASLTFSPKFSVITRRDGLTSYASWDMLIQDKKPYYMDLDPANEQQVRLFEKYVTSETGTLIVWEDATFRDDEAVDDGDAVDSAQAQAKLTRVLVKQVSDYIGFAFHRFLVPGSIEGQLPVSISVNGSSVIPWNPVDETFLVDEDYFQVTKIPMLETVTVGGVEKEVPFTISVFVVKGKTDYEDPAERDRSSISEAWSGLFPYRENRALREPAWDKDYYAGHASLNQVRIILDFDHQLDENFHTPVNKGNIELPNAVKARIGKKLTPIMRAIKKLKQSSKSAAVGPDAEQVEHNGSNAAIREGNRDLTAPEFEGNTVVNGRFGPSTFEIARVDKEEENQKRSIRVVNDLPGFALFEPKLNGFDNIVVLLNKSHDFYQKVYLPLKGNRIANIGLDLLLYGMTYAELMTGHERVSKQFQDMRMQMSLSLTTWLENIDFPDDEESDDGGSEQ